MTGLRVTAGVLLGLGCLLIVGVRPSVESGTLGDPGPNLLPRIVGLAMGVMAVLLFFQAEEPSPRAANPREQGPLTIALSMAAVPAFYLMFQYLGYTLSVGLYLLAAFCLLGERTGAARFRYLLAATAISLTSGLLFARLLDLPLPGVLP